MEDSKVAKIKRKAIIKDEQVLLDMNNKYLRETVPCIKVGSFNY